MDGSLLEPDDLKEFERRVQKAKEYYDGIIAYTGQNVIGEVCVNEGLTEVCGLQARLAYAAKQDDFDYKAFFENRAKMARFLRTPELEQQCIMGADKHPSAYIDVNGPAQMFEEFYETYDVKEGDGMYLAPDARIALWQETAGLSRARTRSEHSRNPALQALIHAVNASAPVPLHICATNQRQGGVRKSEFRVARA